MATVAAQQSAEVINSCGLSVHLYTAARTATILSCSAWIQADVIINNAAFKAELCHY